MKTMEITIKYAKPGDSGHEEYREKSLTFKKTDRATWNWLEFATAASFHRQDGERIVAIVEMGYD